MAPSVTTNRTKRRIWLTRSARSKRKKRPSMGRLRGEHTPGAAGRPGCDVAPSNLPVQFSGRSACGRRVRALRSPAPRGRARHVRRIVLVHWNAAEAAERVARLARSGYDARVLSGQGGAGLRRLRANPPDAIVIDLARLPSQGLAVATFLRQQKATRGVPLVFVGGAPEKVARARALLPDATYADWGRVRGALRKAIARRTERPVVPGTMDAYSGT